MLTIVIPVKNPPCLKKFIEGNRSILSKYKVIVIDSGGGQDLKPFATNYLEIDTSLWNARRIGYEKVDTPFTMNLDADVLIPENYIEEALTILQEDERVGAVSIFFKKIRNHGALVLGVSIWRTGLLRQLYDYATGNSNYSHVYCECLYMWRKLLKTGYKLETLPLRAIHLKEEV